MGNVFLFIGALPQLCFPLLHGRASLEGIYGTFLLYPVNSLCHSPCNGAWVVVMFLQEEGVHKLLPQLTVWKSLREVLTTWASGHSSEFSGLTAPSWF